MHHIYISKKIDEKICRDMPSLLNRKFLILFKYSNFEPEIKKNVHVISSENRITCDREFSGAFF